MGSGRSAGFCRSPHPPIMSMSQSDLSLAPLGRTTRGPSGSSHGSDPIATKTRNLPFRSVRNSRHSGSNEQERPTPSAPIARMRKSAGRCRLKYRRAVLHPGSDQCPSQVSRDILLRSPGCNGVTECGPECFAQSNRRFLAASRLDRSQDLQQRRNGSVGNGAIAEHR